MSSRNKKPIDQIISAKEMEHLKQKMFKRFVIAAAIILALLILGAWQSFKWIANNELDKAAEAASTHLATIQSLQESDFNFLANIIFQLTHDSELRRYVIDRNELSEQFILDNWITVAEQVKWISQICYLSNSGYEVLRVEYNRLRDFAESAPSLQNKQSRDYFQHSKSLEEGQLYISPISLNREYNEFSYPLTPVMRFAMPVLQPSGQKAGIIIINFFAEKLLAVVNEVLAGTPGDTLVLDNAGHFIQGYNEQQNWSHELAPDKPATFSGQLPSVWSTMQVPAIGNLKVDNARFIFRPLTDNVEQDSPNRYLIVQHITDKHVQANYAAQRRNLYFLFPTLFLLSIVWVRSLLRDRLVKEVEHNSLELISALFHSKEAICIADSEWRVAAVNSAFCESTGYSFEDVEGVSSEQLYFIDNADELAAITTSITDTGSWLGEVQSQRKDGTQHTNLMFASATSKRGGSTSHFVLQMFDITERKAMENELKVAAVAFDTRSAITITDKDGNIIRANDAFTEITGYPLEEVLGQNQRILSSGKHDKAFYETLWQTIVDNGFWQGEIWNKHKNGRIYPEWITISAIKDDSGEIVYYVATFEDISERKRLEAQLAELSGVEK